jgi:ferritin-like metal-binding protein YciE
MTPNSLNEQLTKYLTDAHAIEQQALAQMKSAPKLAAFAFAVENLESGAYEMLRRIAERASDPDTVRVAELILAQEHAAAERIRELFPRALDAALEEQGVGTVR